MLLKKQQHLSRYTKHDAKYIVRGDFTVPLTEWVADLSWSASDPSCISVDQYGNVKVYPKSGEDVVLTLTASYNGVSKTKKFLIVLANYNNTTTNIVKSELSNSTLYPNGTDGEAVTTITLSEDGTTKIPFDVVLKTTSSTDKNLTVSWSSSDENVLGKDGVIHVTDKDPHEVTLTKTVSYEKDGTVVSKVSQDYKVNVQFDPENLKDNAEATAKAYADAKVAKALEADSTISETTQKSTYDNAYNSAMEMIFDRYVTRFDGAYEKNVSGIEESVSDDFELPTEGYFGSTISWGSSDTCVKVSGGDAKVTQPSSTRTVTLSATYTSGSSVNSNAASVQVKVKGKSNSSSGGSSGGSSSGSSSSSSYKGGGNSYIGTIGAVMPAATASPSDSTVGSESTIKGEFTDLDQASWAANAINYLANKGIVSGRDSVTFAPNDNITRAEFAKIIAGAFGIATGATENFSDVASDAWYAPYVGACYAAGIITGYEDGTFKPDALVSRQEMAVMLKRAADEFNVTLESINDKIDFEDEGSIADYAKDAVASLQQAGIINGMTATEFAPSDTATRAQAAKMLYGLMDK
jgi:hypothetical protein